MAGWNGTTNITSETNCIFNPPFQLADTNLCSVSYFDHFGRVDRTKNAKRQITTLGYDGLGRTASTIRPLSNVTYNEYDVLGIYCSPPTPTALATPPATCMTPSTGSPPLPHQRV